MAQPLLALVGPTASGKTSAALTIAERLGAEIVSIDSMLVYRGMDVGTAKPTAEERARVPHHLIDVASPTQRFTVARFRDLAGEALAGIADRGNRALLVGGSGLYFRAVVDELEFPAEDHGIRGDLEREAAVVGARALHGRLAAIDPAAASKIEPANARRTVRALEVAAITGRPFSSFASAWARYPATRVRAAGAHMRSDVLAARIEARVRAMLERGFLAEVRSLIARGFGGWLTASQAIGYAEMVDYLEGRMILADAVARTEKRTRALARRQKAWFRRDPRIVWFDTGSEGAPALVDEIVAYLGGV